jgi:hypothetical protein
VKANYRYFQELASLYALDLLNHQDRLWVKAQTGSYPDLAPELASYHTAVALMFYSAPTAIIAADLKDRLFNRLNLDPVSLPLQP